jgi:hypothetical protein
MLFELRVADIDPWPDRQRKRGWVSMYEETFNMERREILPMNMFFVQTAITSHDHAITVLPAIPNFNSDVIINDCPLVQIVPYNPSFRFKIRDQFGN